MSRTRLAFVIAPLWVPLVVPVITEAFLYRSPAGLMADLIPRVITSVIFGYGGTLVLGVPLFRFLRSRQITGFWAAPVFGFIVAMITWGIPLGLLHLSAPKNAIGPSFMELATDAGFLAVIFVPGVVGMMVGVTLWLIARPDRPPSFS
jgi:hypothetical protein